MCGGRGDSGAISERGGREVVESLCGTAGGAYCCGCDDDGSRGGVGEIFGRVATGSWLMTASILARFIRAGSFTCDGAFCPAVETIAPLVWDSTSAVGSF